VLVLGLFCAGAAATELVIQARRYHFAGRASDGSYHFDTEPQMLYQRTWVDSKGVGHSVSVGQGGRSSISGKELDAAGVEQERKDLEEIDVLRRKNARELLEVIDIEVNGRLHRTFRCKYVLADGRTKTMGESPRVKTPDRSPTQMDQDQEQIDDLSERGQKEVTKVIDTELDGQIQRTLICRYVLADGREVTQGRGDPDLAPPSKFLTPKQHRELSRLVSLKQGEFLGNVEAQMFGKTFTFKRYSFQLSDGTVVTHSEGEPPGPKTQLTEADWKELGSLRINKRAGEPLAEYSEQIDGKVFRFSPARYVLSDGTRVVWSLGKPPVNR
jgi:hypothetical protein